MGQLLKTFIASKDALRLFDWFIPACGQLALIYVFMKDINNALQVINGTQLSPGYYWSSSEKTETNAWLIYFAEGRIVTSQKYHHNWIRFIRDL